MIAIRVSNDVVNVFISVISVVERVTLAVVIESDILTILVLIELVVTVSTNDVQDVLNSEPVATTDPVVAVPDVADSMASFALVHACLFSVRIFIFFKFESVTEAFVPIRLPE